MPRSGGHPKTPRSADIFSCLRPCPAPPLKLRTDTNFRGLVSQLRTPPKQPHVDPNSRDENSMAVRLDSISVLHGPSPSRAVLLNVFTRELGVTNKKLAIGFVGNVTERWCGGKMTRAALGDRKGARKNPKRNGAAKNNRKGQFCRTLCYNI